MKKLHIYIIKEFIPNYLLGFMFFSIFLIVQLLFQIVPLYIEDNAPLSSVLFLWLYGTAWTISFSIPIAVLLGTILSLGRVAGDSEITAMRANGIGLLTIFKPVIALGFIIMSFNVFYYEVIYPWGMFKYYHQLANLGKQDPTTQLGANSEYESRDYIIQIDRVERTTREMINVRILMKNDNKMIIAERGHFLTYDEKNQVFPLILINTITQPLHGDDELGNASLYEMRSKKMTVYIDFKVNQADFAGNYMSWAFSKLALEINQIEVSHIERVLNNIEKQANIIQEITKNNIEIYNIKEILIEEDEEDEEKSVLDKDKKEIILEILNEDLLEEDIKKIYTEAQRRLKNYSIEFSQYEDTAINFVKKSRSRERWILEFHKKLSFSFSCLAFALLGAPLSVFSARSGKSYGLGVSLLFISVWYAAYFLSDRNLSRVPAFSFLGIIINVADPVFRAWLPPLILLPVAGYLWYKKLQT